MQYDIFISFSSMDAEWAEMLYRDLAFAGIDEDQIFMDRRRIVAGEKWEPQLLGALADSKHLVVLWSQLAKDSDWVHQETGRFLGYIDPTGTGENRDGRKIIYVSMDIQNKSTTSTQAIDDLRVSGDYARGAANVNQGVWTKVVNQISEAVKSKYDVTSINLAVVAMTEDKIPGLPFNYPLPPQRAGAPPETLGNMLGRIDINSPADLLPYYGPKETDWRPFRNPAETISTIMARVGWQMNRAMRKAIRKSKTKMAYKPLRWELVGDFWSGTQEANTELDKLEDGKSVIVIDPLSLYDNDINYRFGKLHRTFLNKDALVMVFAPFNLPTPTNVMRALVSARATQIYEYFYEPAMTSGESFATCGPDVGDEMDVKRWLLTAIRPRSEVVEGQIREDNAILHA